MRLFQLPAAREGFRERWKQAVCLLLPLLLFMPHGLAGCERPPARSNSSPPVINIGGDKSWVNLQSEVNQLDDGGTIDLTSYQYPVPQGIRCSVTVPLGLSLRLVGNRDWQYGGVTFLFEGDNTLNIEDVFMCYESSQVNDLQLSALHFKGGDNRLVLSGDNGVLMLPDADGRAGFGAAIGVPEGSSLTIKGEGSLRAIGGGGGAGIGGGYGAPSGNVTITGGRITVHGGTTANQLPDAQQSGAAIGGGWGATGGMTTILGGDVVAHAGDGAAAIGGGGGGGGGTVTISGGCVEAHSGGGAAAIGGGIGGGGGVIVVEGGEVTAYGEAPGSAVGGGVGGSAGTLAVTGGLLRAVGSGETHHAAINCAITALPSRYNWRAGDLAGGLTEEGHYPDTGFVNSEGYGFVDIEAQ